jgi:ubiquitin-protein ligase
MEKSEIRDTRIRKEREILQKMNSANCLIEFSDVSDSFELATQVHGYSVNFYFDIPDKYPFEPPIVRIGQSSNLTSLTEFPNNSNILEQILGHSWLPVQNLAEISEKLILYAQQSFKLKHKALIIDFFSIRQRWSIATVLLISSLLRTSVIYLPHSGGDSLIPGEYEKYHYWSSLTHTTPISKWYSPEYQIPLSIPPLGVYFVYILSFLSSWADENSISYETFYYDSDSYTLFVRFSTIFFEIIIFGISVLVFFRVYYKNLAVGVKSAACVMILACPCFVLVTDVKFSYNFIAVGLVLWAVIFVIQDMNGLAIVFMGLTLNFKQEAGVFLVPVVVACNIRVVKKARKIMRKTKPSMRTLVFLAEMAIGISSLLVCFALCLVVLWAPWMSSSEDMKQVLKNLLSVSYPNPDKIYNFISILPENYSSPAISYILTTIFSAPFLLFLHYKKPFIQSFLYCISGVSLSYYLFFLQESSDSILYPLLPLGILLIIDYPEIFQAASLTFALTLYGQMSIDGSRSAYFGLGIFFYIVSESYINSVSYFQSRKIVNFKVWKFFFICVHMCEFINEEIFDLGVRYFVIGSLGVLWVWLVKGYKEIKKEATMHYNGRSVVLSRLKIK